MIELLRNSTANDLAVWTPPPDVPLPKVAARSWARVHEWLEEVDYIRKGVQLVGGGTSFSFTQTVQAQGADGASYNTSTTETALATTVTFLGSGTGTVAGGFWQAEKVLGLHFRGILSTTGTPNWTTNVRQDSTAGTSCGAQTLYATASGIASLPFAVDALLVCRADGTAGNVESCVEYGPGATPGSATNSRTLARANVGSFDTTGNRLFMVTGLWGTSSASNIAIAKIWIVEVMN